jgi:hypothetical protein
MNDTLTIILTPELQAILNTLSEKDGVPPEALVQAAVEDYLFVRKFRALRSQLMQKVPSNYTDEDIFEMVS